MELQTAQIDNAMVSDNDINAALNYEKMKKLLVDTVSLKMLTFNKLFQMNEELESLMSERDELLSLFRSEAIHLYPELEFEDIGAYLLTLPSSHQLVQIWAQYGQKIEILEKQVLDAIETDEGVKALYDELSRKEFDIINNYAAFKNSTSADIPSVEQFKMESYKMVAIPQVDEGSTVVSVDALNLLDPTAAALVIAQSEANKSPETPVNLAQIEAKPLTKNPAVVFGAIALLIYLLGVKQ